MKRMSKSIVTSLAVCITFAHLYAIIERNLNFSYVGSFFDNLGLPKFSVVSSYQYLFMFGLFLFISAIPLVKEFISNAHLRKRIISLILGNVLLISLIEDMAYFYLYGVWIQPFNWTTKVIGYVTWNGTIIPNWYFPIIVSIISLYTFALFGLSNRIYKYLFLSFSIMVELHQRLKGYSFNLLQLFDTKLHHEHLTLFFISLSVISLLINRSSGKELIESSEVEIRVK